MYIINDIAYANSCEQQIKVTEVKVIDELYLLLTFSSREQKVYDASPLLKYPVYEKLKDFNFFRTVSIDRGMLVWNNGEIDIAPETLYRDGFAYEVAWFFILTFKLL